MWQQEEATAIEASKTKLAKEYGLPRDAKFDLAWGIAWSNGHSSGLSEVEGYFSDLIPLLRP
jgi:hypothetical protein